MNEFPVGEEIWIWLVGGNYDIFSENAPLSRREEREDVAGSEAGPRVGSRSSWRETRQGHLQRSGHFIFW